MEAGGYVEKDTGAGNEEMYWGPKPRFQVTAFCIPEEDAVKGESKPKHKSPSTIRTQAAHAEKMAALEAKKAEELANAAMIKADGPALTAGEKQSKLIDAMVGNGNIFAPPKRTTHPLFRVTPMTTTGHVLWGAEHGNE